MVAAARLRRAEQRIEHLRPYARAIRQLTRRAAEEAGHVTHVPALEQRETVRNAGVLLITGDRGLAGAFNTNIIREGLREKSQLESDGAHVTFLVVGRRGESALTFRKQELAGSYTGFTDRP